MFNFKTNMKKIIYLISIFCLLLNLIIFEGCGQPKEVETKKEVIIKDSTEIKVASPELSGLYSASDGIHYFNTIEKTDDLIIEIEVSEILLAKTNAYANKIAFALRTKNNETFVYFYDFQTKKSEVLKKNKGLFAANLFWENEKILIMNLCSIKRSGKSKVTDYSNPYTEFYDFEKQKITKSFKPRRGIVLEDYIQSKYLVYSDLTSLYILDKNNTKTIKTFDTFSYDNMKNLSFSPDGKYFFYLERKPDPDEKSKKILANELILADYLGNNDITVFNLKHNPRNPSWSPDSKKILCDIESPDSKGVRYMAIYDVETNRSNFKKEEIGDWKYSLENGYWIFSGDMILLKKILKNEGRIDPVYEIRDTTLFLLKSISIGADSLGLFNNYFSDSLIYFQKMEKSIIFNLQDNSILRNENNIDYLFIKTIK